MLNRFRGRSPRASANSAPATQVLPETNWTEEDEPTGTPAAGRIVITISSQFGSGGSEIGRIVARKCGLLYLDHQIISEVAKRLGITEEQVAQQEEQTSGAVGHILDALQSSSPFTINTEALLNPLRVPPQAQEQARFRLTQKVIRELATVGNAVIVGRGSQFLLHSAPRTLHIYIFAPLPYRITNVMKHSGLSHDEAAALVSKRDQEHEAYLRRWYGSHQDQPSLYHLLINTSLFPFDLAANLIEEAVPLVKEMGT
jgi:cytidylate kinase